MAAAEILASSACHADHHTPIRSSTMPKQRRARTIPQYLPPYDGPKLQRFRYHNFPIQWLGRLDDDRDEGSGRQGFVFHVKINDREYALKVVGWQGDSVAWYPIRQLTKRFGTVQILGS